VDINAFKSEQPGSRRIVGTVTEPEAVRRPLGALGLAAQPPPDRPVIAS
jgi:hypothetical protein